MIRAEYACIIPVTVHLKEILVGNSDFERLSASRLSGLTLVQQKMSDVRLSNASPTVERVDARQQDNVRQVRRALFGRTDPEETRRYVEAMAQEGAQDFMERYNFDLINDRPLSPGHFEWQEDNDAPEFYRRPPHRSQRAPREAGSPDGNGRQEGQERTRTPPGRAADTKGSRKRRSEASDSCSSECPRKRSRSDSDDDGAGSGATAVAVDRPSGAAGRDEAP